MGPAGTDARARGGATAEGRSGSQSARGAFQQLCPADQLTSRSQFVLQRRDRKHGEGRTLALTTPPSCVWVYRVLGVVCFCHADDNQRLVFSLKAAVGRFFT